ncbi:hypothetical protein KAT08_03535 [Candidatus Babeliales bacterium]|nr:hypothetical protein [Candidatus Babeliales bacterium]
MKVKNLLFLFIICPMFFIIPNGLAETSKSCEEIKTTSFNQKNIIDQKKVFYKENPWLFIQKKLLEEPNNKLINFKSICIDAFIVGGVGLLFSAIQRTPILLGAFIFIYVNSIRNTNAKVDALRVFLSNYDPDPIIFKGYKEYTPKEIWPIFDYLSKLSKSDLELFFKSSDFFELLKDIKRLVKKNNNFSFKDNFYKKLKYTATGFLVISYLLLSVTTGQLILDLKGRLNSVNKEIKDINDTLAGIIFSQKFIGEQIKRDSNNPISDDDMTWLDMRNKFFLVVSDKISKHKSDRKGWWPSFWN